MHARWAAVACHGGNGENYERSSHRFRIRGYAVSAGGCLSTWLGLFRYPFVFVNYLYVHAPFPEATAYPQLTVVAVLRPRRQSHGP